MYNLVASVTLRLKCDGTSAETIFRLLAKQTSPFKSAGTLVQSNTGSRSVRISGINAGYTMFRGTVKSTGYPLHSPSLSLPLPCVTVRHHISTGVYNLEFRYEAMFCVEIVPKSTKQVVTFPPECLNTEETKV